MSKIVLIQMAENLAVDNFVDDRIWDLKLIQMYDYAPFLRLSVDVFDHKMVTT